ncbi:MAG TPA: CYCXC family (seleno)protein [Verrucomicrobiae bacterium]|nr:CYCXC family (seleno)protein [Verrucomicrobiae bacterium]
MKAATRFAVLLSCCFAVTFAFAPKSARAQDATKSPAAVKNAPPVPPYHKHPPASPLPATLDPSQFSDPETRNIYALAAKVKALLYQMPCYCGCDKEAGHKSLLDCYRDMHASGCDLCKKEAVFAATESKKGRSPAQIRKEIILGDWKSVNLSSYAQTTQAR